MRILFLHNKYQIVGGEDVSTIAEIELLRKYGHEVDCIFADNDDIDDIDKVALALNTIWSKKFYNLISDKLKSKKYDIMHVQNFFPLMSPSVFKAAKDNNVKTVMTVHNYRLVCPNALTFVNGEICTACVGKTIPYPALSKKCYKNDFSATAVTVAMLSYNNLRNNWNKNIDAYIAVSKFVKKQLVDGGFNENNVKVKYNFVESALTKQSNSFEGNYLFVGRLSAEKGIQLLLDAFSSAQLSTYQLSIVGNGPLSPLVEKYALKFPNIKYLGQKSIDQTYQEMSKAKALIFPSKWNEPFGRTIIEGFAHGLPAIGSALGGVTELIINGYNGFLFDPFLKDDLIQKVLKLEAFDDYTGMKTNAVKSFKENYTEEIGYKTAMEIYNSVLSLSI